MGYGFSTRELFLFDVEGRPSCQVQEEPDGSVEEELPEESSYLENLHIHEDPAGQPPVWLIPSLMLHLLLSMTWKLSSLVAAHVISYVTDLGLIDICWSSASIYCRPCSSFTSKHMSP